ncbi:MAG: 2-succinyl-5-enolpyruvyl-6-hydroxy-3-cyclohexene-1-carboxylic-acid synthase [Nocardioidaceae bacterium]
MNASTRTAVAVVQALRWAGVTDVVLAPGSRSAALAVVLHQADAAGLLRLHVRIDERTAAFLALGLAKGSHRPVAVVTTSGTAVANLHPAVLEACHVGARLVVVSADRPASMRGTGANQTTDQPGMFGLRIPCVDVGVGDEQAARAAVAAAAEATGPTHVNIQFAEPLLPDSLPVDLAVDVDGAHPDRQGSGSTSDRDSRVRLEIGRLTVVVAGDDAGPPARLLAQEANWPLLAEPTSGSRTGTHAVRTYRLLLDTDLGSRIERVLITGHPTLSRPVTRLISRSDIEVLSVVGPVGVATDPARVARHLSALPVVEGSDDDGWVDEWRRADAALSARIDRLVATDPDALPLRVAGVVAAAVTPEALLVVGSSQPVRDLDLMAPPYPAGQRRLVIGNRGLAGIDGTVSTAVGAALGRRSSRSLAYLGDLTFLHDTNGLVIGPGEPVPDLTVVVANDDGGAIFGPLEQGGRQFAASFERVFATPHGVDIGALCGATGTAYVRADDADELAAVLAEDAAGIRVVEVPLSRTARRALAARVAALTDRL